MAEKKKESPCVEIDIPELKRRILVDALTVQEDVLMDCWDDKTLDGDALHYRERFGVNKTTALAIISAMIRENGGEEDHAVQDYTTLEIEIQGQVFRATGTPLAVRQAMWVFSQTPEMLKLRDPVSVRAQITKADPPKLPTPLSDKEADDLREECEQLREENDALKGRLERAKDVNQRQAKKITELSATVKEREIRLAELEDQIGAGPEVIEKLQAELAQLRKEKQDVIKLSVERAKTIDQQAVELEKLRAKLEPKGKLLERTMFCTGCGKNLNTRSFRSGDNPPEEKQKICWRCLDAGRKRGTYKPPTPREQIKCNGCDQTFDHIRKLIDHKVEKHGMKRNDAERSLSGSTLADAAAAAP